MIYLKNINLNLKSGNSKKIILKDVSLEIPDSKITTLIGKSGAGKTSILRCLVGLENHYEGKIEFPNNIKSPKIGFVAQNYNLFSNMTVLENCVQPQVLTQDTLRDIALNKALGLLKEFGIDQLINCYPSNLSGGQQQRVAIIRALLLEPKYLAFDEPTSALDPENTNFLVNLLKKLASTGIGIIVSSQDMSFVKLILDRAYLIDNGEILESFDLDNNILKPESYISKFINT